MTGGKPIPGRRREAAGESGVEEHREERRSAGGRRPLQAGAQDDRTLAAHRAGGAPHTALVFLLALAVTSLLSSCDPSFSVFRESDLYFSVTGVLDAGVDTQWVRITALGGRSSAELEVTLTEFGTDRAWLLRDSLFQFDGGGTAYLYWAAMPLRHGTAYRLDIDDGDGRRSGIDVVIPDSFPDPVFDPPPYAFQEKADGLLVVSGVSLPAAVDFIYGFVQDGDLIEIPFSHIGSLVTGPGDFRATINWGQDLKQLAPLGPAYATIRTLRIRVTAASPGWPGPSQLSYDDSPVENGIGYVGGLFTREINVQLGPITGGMR